MNMKEEDFSECISAVTLAVCTGSPPFEGMISSETLKVAALLSETRKTSIQHELLRIRYFFWSRHNIKCSNLKTEIEKDISDIVSIFSDRTRFSGSFHNVDMNKPSIEEEIEIADRYAANNGFYTTKRLSKKRIFMEHEGSFRGATLIATCDVPLKPIPIYSYRISAVGTDGLLFYGSEYRIFFDFESMALENAVDFRNRLRRSTERFFAVSNYLTEYLESIYS